MDEQLHHNPQEIDTLIPPQLLSLRRGPSLHAQRAPKTRRFLGHGSPLTIIEPFPLTRGGMREAAFGHKSLPSGSVAPPEGERVTNHWLKSVWATRHL